MLTRILLTRRRILWAVAMCALLAATSIGASRPLQTESAGSHQDVDLAHVLENEDVFGLHQRQEHLRRKLQQETAEAPGWITGPVNAVSGALCTAIPRDMYQEYLGMPWWAPMGVAQGVCSSTFASTLMGGSL
ncbi:hypothetical protein HKI87_12g71250 [Chloropicon roscoffensis]|uniref:Uncharacterized protein n=1 Tax=Chloropicon roscoffensis TaxID=1461544 RepID=A0AAX4PHS4_9CHLO|mmetsp:Transcript_5243/g.15849  ORF Transcript_5243/g.15849 Transcript_5243/m.15849 type:complete len:133 (+) Transcript_5243:135-533(+)